MISASWICVLKAEGYDDLVLNGQGDNNLPEGWEQKKVAIKRSPTYFGLNRMVTTSPKFVTNGKDYIQRIFENEGTQFQINIAFYEYNEPPTDKYFLFFAGIIDLSRYSIEELFLTVNIDETSMARKLMSRDSIKVNLASLTSIEGLTLPANNEVSVTLQEREIKLIGDYDLNPDNLVITSSIGPHGTSGLICPINLQAEDVDNLAIQPYGDVDSSSSLFWLKSGVDSAVRVSGNAKGFLSSAFSTTGDRHFSIRIYVDDVLDDYTNTIVFDILDENFINDADFDFSFDIDSFHILGAWSMAFICYSSDNAATFAGNFEELNLEIEVNQLFDSTTAPGYLMHEVGERISQVITDKVNCFKSDFLGRIDIGYENDGDGALQSVHSGEQIRNIPNSHPSSSLLDWYKSINSMYNLGLGQEFDEFNNPLIRVEEKAHFFSGEVIVTIHSVTEIKKEVAREWIYNEVEVGYAKSEYEEVNGREEHNNKFEWANSIHTIKNKLDLVSKLRADGYGIEFARRLQYDENPTEDSKYDNENFTVIVKLDGANYKNVQDENYDLAENIFSPETAYNLDITPGRMLRNNGSVIRAGLEHSLTDPLRFQFAEQKANLKSQKTGESAITENEDIDVSTLRPGLWIPEIYSFKSILTREQLAIITKKSNGIIKFSTTTFENTTKYYYGWILDIDSEPEGEEATWQLLRVNTKSPDVTLIDPEGNTPTQPPIEVDPSEIIGAFEGPFSFIFSG